MRISGGQYHARRAGAPGTVLASLLPMRWRARRRLALALVVAGVAWFAVSPRGSLIAAGPIRCGIEMRNLTLHVADGIVLQVRALDGEFVSRSATEPPIFDDPQSYTLRVKAADMQLDGASLTSLFQQSMKAHPSPLSDVKITIEGGQMKAAGKLKKGV